MTYQFDPPIYDADPDRVREELEGLQSEDGVVNPEAIVQKARSPKSAMHAMFEWDDTEAAQKYRLMQAKQIFRIFVVETKVKQEDGTFDVVTHRVYEKAPKGYKPVLAMVDHPDEWEFLLTDVKGELSAARAKLITLQALGQACAKKAQKHLDLAIRVLKKDE
jgi:hypothetical protein